MLEWRPPLSDQALRERLVGIDIIEAGSREVTVLPSTAAVLGVQIRGRIRAGDELLATAGVTGIQPTARRYTYVDDTVSILVRFTPQGATCLGVTGADLAGRSVALADVLPSARVQELHERLVAAATTPERVAIVERFVLGLPWTADPLITRALELLDTAPHEEGRVAAIARVIGLSERQLERRFVECVGLTPKRFATLRRFERAVRLAKSTPTLAGAAVEAGYYDQSHFIRDVRKWTGASPKQLGLADRTDVGIVQSWATTPLHARGRTPTDANRR